MDSRRGVPLVAAGLATAAILVATLAPGRNIASAGVGPRSEGPFPLSDVVRNLILFAPLGACLAWSRVPALRALALAALLSGGIELAQGLVPIAGRDATVRDGVANAVGAGIALALFRVPPAWLRPTPAHSRWLGLAAGVAAAAVLVATGFLAEPAPTRALYFGHHTPSLARFR